MEPLSTITVIGRLLGTLGGPTVIPTDLDEAAATLRTTLAGRRVLVVLDNAANTAQVRPLLPGDAGCAVIVTSRSLLAGLDSVGQVALDLFSRDSSVALLRELNPVGHLESDPDAAVELAALCSDLPLALRVLASRIASRPSWPIGEFVERLGNERRRLDQLGHGDISVRGCFKVSYDVLQSSDDSVDVAASQWFPLMGAPSGADISLPVATRLFDAQEGDAEAVLDRLVDLHLVESPMPGRFRMHDLLRLYARELAEARLTANDRFRALHRTWEVYAATAERASEQLRPGYFPELEPDSRHALPLSSVDQATRWMNEERANIVAAIEQAARCPGKDAAIAVRLSRVMFHVMTETDASGLRHISELAMVVARSLNDRKAEARALSDQSVAPLHLGAGRRRGCRPVAGP